MKGSQLFYGYKITEEELLEKFFTKKFKRFIYDKIENNEEFISESVRDFLDGDASRDENLIYNELKYLFLEYYNSDDAFLGKCPVDETNPIRISCAPCCLYANETNWIIGLSVCKLPAFSLRKAHKPYEPSDREINRLMRIKRTYNLETEGLNYYSMPTDCNFCT